MFGVDDNNEDGENTPVVSNTDDEATVGGVKTLSWSSGLVI